MKYFVWSITFIVTTAIVSFNISKINAQDVGHIVISQIETGGSTNDEFVELFNPTASSINLANYKLTRRNSGGITEANLVTSLSGTITSNGYFLIGPATGYLGSVSLDANYSAISNALTNNYSVRIYSDAGVLLDKVGYGTSPDAETLPFTANPGVGQSIRRINNQDTDNNSVDFELLDISSPRNSSFLQPIMTSTPVPTELPTPTDLPIVSPTSSMTPTATPVPTEIPTTLPTPSIVPTDSPTESPIPTELPTPTSMPAATSEPTSLPTVSPSPTPVGDSYKNFGQFIKTLAMQGGWLVREYFRDLFGSSYTLRHYVWPSYYEHKPFRYIIFDHDWSYP